MEPKHEIQSLSRQKVYDPVLRLLHLVMGVSILGLLLTGKAGEFMEEGSAKGGLWTLHIALGYVLSGTLLTRLAWGLVGPKHARWSDMLHLRTWWETLRTRMRPSVERFGHDPLASLAYLLFYLLAFGAATTGLGLAALEHNRGPLASWLFDAVWLEEAFEEPHEVAGTLILFFILIHLGALVWHEVREGIPLAQGMVSGFQYRRVSQDPPATGRPDSRLPNEQGERGSAASSLLLGVGVFLGTGLLLSGLVGSSLAGSAELPILGRYIAEARAATPSFKAPDAARGKGLYELQRTTSTGERASCSECHSANPKAPGKTRAGKLIEPMATSVTPTRFTDPAKVEKWFGRNCKDVLERPCTAAEKADFLLYLSTVP